MTDPAAARKDEWEKAYDEAVQWRDWMTCDRLLDERDHADWYTSEVAEEHTYRGFKLHPAFAALGRLLRAR